MHFAVLDLIGFMISQNRRHGDFSTSASVGNLRMQTLRELLQLDIHVH